MQPTDYSPAQKEDIEKRVAQAKTFLEGIGLKPSAGVYATNLGEDNFGLKVIPYLQDVKYTSPINKADL